MHCWWTSIANPHGSKIPRMIQAVKIKSFLAISHKRCQQTDSHERCDLEQACLKLIHASSKIMMTNMTLPAATNGMKGHSATCHHRQPIR
jgi:hypothetical protein